MPIKWGINLVRYVNLNTGQLKEEEMSDFRLDSLKLIEQMNGSIQILDEKYIRTEGVK